VIDAHVHLWRLNRHGCTWPGADLPALYRDFTTDDLWPVLAGTGVARVILVQSQQDEAESQWLLSLAAADARIAGVIGWVDLRIDDAVARIDRLRAGGPLVGLRPMVQDLGDDWYDDPAIDDVLAFMACEGLVLDALVRPRHLPALTRLAERHPALSIIIDHAAKPIDGLIVPDWSAAMEGLAALPEVACKLSGLVTELRQEAVDAEVLPVIGRLCDWFGTDRLIWGSDWPVLTLRQGYDEWLMLARGAIPSGSHAAVFGDNAARIYRLAA
jgi:L-fuconolactonase